MKISVKLSLFYFAVLAVFILLALVVLALLLWAGLKHLANFMPWARGLLAALSAWWERLWGKPASPAAADATARTRGC